MGEALSRLFVPVDQLPELYKLPEQCVASDEHRFSPHPTIFGLFQLAFLGATYAGLLSWGSNLVSDGSELLLLIPSLEHVVGSLVLPILGAVPDGCLVLFSGLGNRATVAKQVAVGVGALAGSTIQLLTVPWFLAVYAGRVDLDERGIANYDTRRRSKRFTGHGISGVQPSPSVMRPGAIALLVTTLPYFLIQGSAFASRHDQSAKERSSEEGAWALTGVIVCLLMLGGYIYHNARGNNESAETVIRSKQQEARLGAILSGQATIEGAFYMALNHRAPELLRSMSAGDLGSKDLDEDLAQFRGVLWAFFKRYDRNGDHQIDSNELGLLLRDLGSDDSPKGVQEFLAQMDHDRSGTIDFDEFIIGMANRLEARQYASSRAIPAAPSSYGSIEQPLRVLMENRPSDISGQLASGEDDRENQEEGAEEENDDLPSLPDDLKEITGISPEAQQRRILMRALSMMALGTLVVILVSDPLVDVLNALGDAIGVSGFYVSFCLAPVASNASEYIATWKYAAKKSSKSISISLSTLMGAGVLNNTFVLGIFLALVKFRHLEWAYTAETLAILLVELCVGIVALQPVQTMRTAAFVLSLFPLSLFLVAFLENVVGWD